MVRAAAKNHDFVTIVTDPADYTAVVAEMTEQQHAIGATLRRRLAMKAFGHTAAYDAMIAAWLARAQGERFHDRRVLAGRKMGRGSGRGGEGAAGEIWVVAA